MICDDRFENYARYMLLSAISCFTCKLMPLIFLMASSLCLSFSSLCIFSFHLGSFRLCKNFISSLVQEILHMGIIPERMQWTDCCCLLRSRMTSCDCSWHVHGVQEREHEKVISDRTRPIHDQPTPSGTISLFLHSSSSKNTNESLFLHFVCSRNTHEALFLLFMYSRNDNHHKHFALFRMPIFVENGLLHNCAALLQRKSQGLSVLPNK